jgi:hypothetical protein
MNPLYDKGDDRIPTMDLYQRLLGEREQEQPKGHPMLRHFIERGVHSPGEGMYFRSLQYKYPEEYERLMLERVQQKLFR